MKAAMQGRVECVRSLMMAGETNTSGQQDKSDSQSQDCENVELMFPPIVVHLGIFNVFFPPSDFATILHHSCFVYLFIYQRETLELMEPLLQLFYILFCSHRDFQLLLQSHSFNSGFHFFYFTLTEN